MEEQGAQDIKRTGIRQTMKQIYKITYPTGKIYIGKDSYGSYRYFGNPSIDVVNADFERLPEVTRKDYTVRKQILWESETATEAELAAKEVEFIRKYESHNPEIGYNRWPKYRGRSNPSEGA